jgi:translation initiation factor IF-2
MSRPQQPELARSAKTDLDPDHVETGLQGQKKPVSGGETGPVPSENQPGHHPPEEQDKPDLDAFAARLGTDPKSPAATAARKPPRPKAAPAKPATARKKSPAPPPKVEATPAKRPAAAPTAQPASAPSPEDAAHFAAPQPTPDDEHEPRLVGLMLMPLRQTMKGLEQLDRTLSAGLSRRLRTRGGLGPRGR